MFLISGTDVANVDLSRSSNSPNSCYSGSCLIISIKVSIENFILLAEIHLKKKTTFLIFDQAGH